MRNDEEVIEQGAWTGGQMLSLIGQSLMKSVGVWLSSTGNWCGSPITWSRAVGCFANFTLYNLHSFPWFVSPIRPGLTNLIHHIHSIDNFTKHNMLSIQPASLNQSEEELRSI